MMTYHIVFGTAVALTLLPLVAALMLAQIAGREPTPAQMMAIRMLLDTYRMGCLSILGLLSTITANT